MIISCPNCNKNFSINEELIPKNGRLLKCGSCGNTWFYEQNEEPSIQISEPVIKVKNEENDDLIENNDVEKKFFQKKINKDQKKQKNKDNFKNDKSKKYLNNILVILITFIAIIIIVDTFKLSISNVLPGVIPLLDNLYATLYDLQLFLNDLVN